MKKCYTSVLLKNTKIITKVIVPTITFFEKGGKIHEAANKLLIQHIIANQPDSLFLMGSTGEGLYFRDKIEEKMKYIKIAKDVLNAADLSQTIPILIGVYGEITSEVIDDANNSLKVVENASLVIPAPTGRKLEPADQLEFYTEIFEQLSAPIYLYNNPGTFGKTTIDLGVIEKLKEKYSNFKGIKDSSGTIEQKQTYLKALSDNFTISCGKEGMLAEFLTHVPKDKRTNVGIVPSIANIVNTCRKIFDLGCEGKDAEMLALQDHMNQFRSKIYDSAQGSGKAQRGLKIALKTLYKGVLDDWPLAVRPELIRDVEPETVKSIEEQANAVKRDGYINLVEEN
jgi:dihydrodipicolinate synthase/N-acetylneuraminate lyase